MYISKKKMGIFQPSMLSNGFPFQKGVSVRFQPLVFAGVTTNQSHVPLTSPSPLLDVHSVPPGARPWVSPRPEQLRLDGDEPGAAAAHGPGEVTYPS